MTKKAQELWEKNAGVELDEVLRSGAVALVDAEWMVERAKSGGPLEPRQALPSAAFMPLSGVKAAGGYSSEHDKGEETDDFPEFSPVQFRKQMYCTSLACHTAGCRLITRTLEGTTCASWAGPCS